MMQKERSDRQPHDAKDAVQRLRKHALNLSADKTRRRQVEIGKRQHVALNPPLFFFIQRHDHQHRDESRRYGSGSLEADVAEEWSSAEQRKDQFNGRPNDK